MLVNSKKHLLELLPSSITNTKDILKLFTIAKNNRFNIYYENNHMTFIYEDQFIKVSTKEYISNSTKTKHINMKNIILKQSNLSFNITYFRHIYFVTQEFEIISTNVQDYKSIAQLCNSYNTYNFLKEFNSQEYAIRYIIERNPTSFRHLNYKEFGNNSGNLCLRDCGFLKKGMIIKTSDYFRSYKNPLELVNNGSSCCFNDNLSCNLSLVTLEQLEGIIENKHYCGKQETYCTKRCPSGTCYSRTANDIDKKRKDIFIKLWKEIYE